jgi:hypothetical protein
MALKKIKPRVKDKTDNYTFNDVTVIGNLITLNTNHYAKPNVTVSITMGSSTITIDGSYKVYKYTISGSITKYINNTKECTI